MRLHITTPGLAGHDPSASRPARPGLALVLFALATAATGAAAGCDAQAGPEYRGEPVGTVTGQISAPRPASLPDATVLLVWQLADDAAFGERAEVEPELGEFRLQLYGSPPAGLGQSLSRGSESPDAEVPFYVATIALVRADADFSGGGERLRAGDLLGGVEDHVLVYLEADVAEGTRTAELFGGPLAAGYHLMRVERPAEGEDGDFDLLRPAPDDLATPVEVRVADESELDWPNWV